MAFDVDFQTGALNGNASIAGQLANRIVQTLEAVAYPLAIAGIVYSAYVLITSVGNPDALKTAKKNIMYILTGVFLVVFALSIVNAIRYIMLK